MSSTGDVYPSIPRELVSDENFLQFVHNLRAAGFSVSPDQVAGVARIIVHLSWQGKTRDAKLRLRNMIVGVLSKDPDMTEAFDDIFERWWSASIVPLREDQNQSDGSGFGSGIRMVTSTRVAKDTWISVTAILLVLFLIAIWFWLFPSDHNAVVLQRQNPSSLEYPTEYSTMTSKEILFYFAAAVFAFVSISTIHRFFSRLRGNEATLRNARHTSIGNSGGRMTPSRSGRWFGRLSKIGVEGILGPDAYQWRQLDVNRSADSTAQRAGLFSPVFYSKLPRMRISVAIEQRTYHDHTASLMVHAVVQMEIFFDVEVFYYRDNFEIVYRREGSRENLAQLGLCSENSTLLVVGDSEMMTSFPDKESKGSPFFLAKAWERKIWLNIKPVHHWGRGEDDLRRSGFALGSATPAGFSAAIRFIAQRADSNELLDIQLRSSRIASRGGDAPVRLTGHAGAVLATAFAPGGRTLATGSEDATIRIWNALTATTETILNGHDAPVRCVEFSASGLWLASSSDDGTIRIWRLPDGENIRTLRITKRDAPIIRFRPVDDVLGIVDQSDRFRSFQIRRNQYDEDSRLALNLDWALAIAPDLDAALTGGAMGSAAIHAIDRTGGSYPLFGHQKAVTCGTFGLDNTFVVTGALDCTAKVWNRRSGTNIQTFHGHQGAVRCVELSADNRLIATGAADKTARVWGFKSGLPLFEVRHEAEVHSVSLSDNGSLLASGGGDEVCNLLTIK